MHVSLQRSDTASLRPTKHRSTAGVALVEILISVLVVGIGAGTALACISSANRAAEANRARNAGLALCQERIDGMVASPFSPPAVLPTCFGTTWPVPGAETVTSTDSVPVYADPNGVGTIAGTRTVRVSMADAALNLVRVTARVSYSYRGTAYVCETYTLRSPD